MSESREELLRKLAAAQARIAALEADQGTSSKVDTHGGLHATGPVTVGGNMIGRDYIHIIEQTVSAQPDRDALESLVSKHLARLVTDLGVLKRGEIYGAAQDTDVEPLRLADVYVPLNVQLEIPEGMTLEAWLGGTKRGKAEDLFNEVKRPEHVSLRVVTAQEALTTHRQLTVLGRPGSGKSTFGHQAMLTLAQAWHGGGSPEEVDAPFWGEGPAPLPLMIVLRRFADWLEGRPPVAGDIWEYLASQWRDSAIAITDNVLTYLDALIREAPGALIFFDGLDECGEPQQRAQVMAAVEEFMRTQPANVRFLVTARPYAWPGQPDPIKGEYALADFDDQQVTAFIHGWYAALANRQWIAPAQAQRKAEDLLRARSRRDLQPLAANPLLLTLMARLHATFGQLPDDRYDLYHESVELLMQHWNHSVGADTALLDALDQPGLTLGNLRAVLEELAFAVHAESADAGQKASEHTADIGESRMRRAFSRVLDGSHDAAGTVIRYIEQRAALLIAQGKRGDEEQFTFPHRTFQEFLAACHLKDSVRYEDRCLELARAAPDHWQVVLALAARGAGAARGASMAHRLVGGRECPSATGRSADEWPCALLAGLMLQEIGLKALSQSDYSQQVLQDVRGWLASSLAVIPQAGGMPAAQRAQAGEVLAALGDPRFDEHRYYLPREQDDMLGFVHIPANPEFQIGSPSQRVADESLPDHERNDELTPSPECYVSQYLVTVAQFRAYLEHAGLTPGDPDALRDGASHPVRWISWHEALGYCRWLGARLRDDPQFEGHPVATLVREQGWHVSLPSELEWEAAARAGAPGAHYPWGDEFDPERTNAAPTQLRRTSAVGCFPATPNGLYDVCGNVWEWTRSHFLPYPYEHGDWGREELSAADNVRRVVRGGALASDPGRVRCAFRFRLHPDYYLLDVGFRVVLSSAPVNSAL